MIWFATPSEKDWAGSKISQPFQALSAARSSRMPVPTALKWPKESPGCVVYDPDIDDFRTLTPTECDFGYRTSIFKSKAGSRLIITEAAFVLPQVWQPVTAYKGLSSLFADRDPASVTPAEIETAVRNPELALEALELIKLVDESFMLSLVKLSVTSLNCSSVKISPVRKFL